MDPGIDDAWALTVICALKRLKGVSTVAGNVPLDNTFGNARRVLGVLGVDNAPVLPGAEGPLLSRLITAKAFHGDKGLGEWEGDIAPVSPHTPRVWSWWDDHAQELTTSHLIATGPLTNLAIGVLAFPRLMDTWRSVTCMCGALPGAQVDKAQEFNIYVDPHAADIVFHWVKRLRLIGINVAHQALIPVSDLARLERHGRVGQMLSGMLQFYSERSRGEGGDPGAFPIDDVVAVAAVAEPDLFSWQELPLAVVREGPLRGTVVVSPIDLNRQPVQVAVDVDAHGFREWLWDAMSAFAASAAAPL